MLAAESPCAVVVLLLFSSILVAMPEFQGTGGTCGSDGDSSGTCESQSNNSSKNRPFNTFGFACVRTITVSRMTVLELADSHYNEGGPLKLHHRLKSALYSLQLAVAAHFHTAEIMRPACIMS